MVLTKCWHLGGLFNILHDEAAQATEPESIVPLALLSSHGRMMLIGDPRQLPPVVKSKGGLKHGLDCSLMKRMSAQPGVHMIVLNEQHRMIACVSKFPNHFFYHDRIRDSLRATSQVPVKGYSWAASHEGVAFIHVEADECCLARGNGALL